MDTQNNDLTEVLQRRNNDLPDIIDQYENQEQDQRQLEEDQIVNAFYSDMYEERRHIDLYGTPYRGNILNFRTYQAGQHQEQNQEQDQEQDQELDQENSITHIIQLDFEADVDNQQLDFDEVVANQLLVNNVIENEHDDLLQYIYNNDEEFDDNEVIPYDTPIESDAPFYAD